MIKPLECASCHAPLALVDAPSVSCWYCGVSCEVPDDLRHALQVARERTRATAGAMGEWRRLEAIRVPRALYVATSLAPVALLAAGIGAGLAAAGLVPSRRPTVPTALALAVWLPLIPTMYAAGEIGIRNLLSSGVDWISATFASLPPATAGGAPGCRRCGAPLSVEPDDVLVRCAYCDTESLVGVQPERVAAFAAAAAQADASAASATELLVRQRSAARFQVVGRTLAVAGLVALPLVWSFSRSWQASPWSLALALDVWVLGICLWWFAREAFLPPVRIDEVYELEELFFGRKVSTTRPAAASPPTAIRNWDDHATEGVNYLAPALVALLFVALEAVLIWAP